MRFAIVLFLTLLICSLGQPARTDAAPRADADSIPVIFVPGVGGTRLADANNVEYWTAAGYLNHEGLTLYPDQSHPTLYPTNAITEATFLGVHIPSEDNQTYGPVLDFMQAQGFRLYQTYGNPYYQTSAGCDVANQKSNNPNLFVFAYDWRLANEDNAALLAEYVDCVQQFYPETKVNIVAHSMGGMLSRRYIIQYPDTNSVNALITVSGAFLGSGKVVWVFETGDYVFFVADSTILNIINSFIGGNELVPPQAWYDLGGAPIIIEDGQDLNQNGISYESYSYQELVAYLDAFKGKEGFLPGTEDQTFHSYTGQLGAQDDWSSDQTGVQYYHIVGAGGAPDTIAQVVATTFLKCLYNFTICNFSEDMYPLFVIGDQTLPQLSAAKMGPNGNYNAPNATLYTCQASGANSVNVGHTTMMSNPVVQDLLMQWLVQANGGTPAQPPSPSVCGNGGSSSAQSKSRLQHHIVVEGADDIAITNSAGQTNDQNAHTFSGFVEGAAKYAMSEHAAYLLIEDTDDYSITFRTRDEPLFLEHKYGTAKKPRRVERYLDLALPPNANALMQVHGTQITNLKYDADGNGSFETIVKPTQSVKGKLARDVERPTIEISTVARREGQRVTLNATDKGAGVWRVFYSLDGKEFHLYKGPFNVPLSTDKIYAFADDNAGNRSRLFEFELE